MKHLKKFNESVDNSDITFGSIVKYKENNLPASRLADAEFLVKVDGEYNDWGKGDWVIAYQVKPNLTDLEIEEIMNCKVPSDRNRESDWYKLQNLINFIPTRIPKWSIYKVR